MAPPVALAAHAEKRVPYYRELFRALGLSSRDIRTPDDFSRLPILTKDIIRERWRDLIREDVPLERLHRHHSGGSTGVPLTFYRERAYMDASDAGTYRNFLQCGWRPGEMVAFFWGSNERLAADVARGVRDCDRWRGGFTSSIHFTPARGNGRLAAALALLGATIAFGYASTLARFAEFIEASRPPRAPARGRIHDRRKALPAAARGHQLASSDAASTTCMAAAKSRTSPPNVPHGRMHVNADYVVLETDRAAAARRRAAADSDLALELRHAVHPLSQRGLREPVDERCDCGNNFPLMTLDVARVSDNFVLPDGRVVHGEFFTHLMYGSEGIRTFQFHQTAPDQHHALGRARTACSGVGAGARCSATRSNRSRRSAPRRCTVDVRETDAIPLEPRPANTALHARTWRESIAGEQ